MGGMKLWVKQPIHTIIAISGTMQAHSRAFRSGMWCLRSSDARPKNTRW